MERSEMDKKLILLALGSVLLLCAMVVTSAVAQTRVVGVTEGNWFKYGDITGSWSSNDPSATLPDFAFNETEWMMISIENITGTNVTGQMTVHYVNGTEESKLSWIDIDTGEVKEEMLWIISADLDVGHTLYSAGEYSTWVINETVSRTYPDGVRETNHVNFTVEYQLSNGIEIYQYISMNFYWDRSSGVQVEWSQEYISQIGETQTSWSFTVRVTESDIWIIPEFPTLTMAFFTLIAITGVATAWKRRFLRNPTA
jgi:hypothetical protein